MRRKAASIGVVAALLLAAAGAPGQDAPAEQPPAGKAAPSSNEPSWYAQALARADSGLSVTNFWSKGPRMRAESVVGGHRVVTIVNGEWYYAYDATGMDGIAIQRAAAARREDVTRGRPFGNHLPTLIGQGAEPVGTEMVMGTEVDIYRITDGAGARKLWVTKDAAQLPMRVEVFSRKSGTTQYTDYLKWMANLPIDDSFFLPEPNVQLTRYTLPEYLEVTQRQGPTGPVPILYADLLHGSRYGVVAAP